MKKFIIRYWLIIVSIIYLILPLDFIPDVFGPFGLIDDAGLILAAIIREVIIWYTDKKEK